jgi:hypothetical protein
LKSQIRELQRLLGKKTIGSGDIKGCHRDRP